MPALRAARSPTKTAPLTDVSASWASGEYRQAPDRVFLLRGDAAADRQLERLADRPRALAVGPEITLVDHAISFGQGERREAVVIHAHAHDARRRILGAR